jgi:hypothetical protein
LTGAGEVALTGAGEGALTGAGEGALTGAGGGGGFVGQLFAAVGTVQIHSIPALFPEHVLIEVSVVLAQVVPEGKFESTVPVGKSAQVFPSLRTKVADLPGFTSTQYLVLAFTEEYLSDSVNPANGSGKHWLGVSSLFLEQT